MFANHDTLWWGALEAEPRLGELFAERRRRFAGVDTLVQDLDRRLLVAIR